MPRFLFIIFISFSVFAEFTREDLLKRVREIQNLELTLQNEALNWKSEKKNLQLLIQVYQNKNNDSEESLKVLKAEKERLTKKYNEIKTQLDDYNKVIKQLNSELDKLKNDLINKWHSRLPAAMKKILPEEYDLLNSSKSLSEKTSAIEAYTLAYLELQKQNHLLTETQILNGEEWQLNCLYLGTVQGFFMSQNGEKCGRISFLENKWTFVEDPSLKTSLLEAFAQMKQDGRPKLVELVLEVKK